MNDAQGFSLDPWIKEQREFQEGPGSLAYFQIYSSQYYLYVDN